MKSPFTPILVTIRNCYSTGEPSGDDLRCWLAWSPSLAIDDRTPDHLFVALTVALPAVKIVPPRYAVGVRWESVSEMGTNPWTADAGWGFAAGWNTDRIVTRPFFEIDVELNVEATMGSNPPWKSLQEVVGVLTTWAGNDPFIRKDFTVAENQAGLTNVGIEGFLANAEAKLLAARSLATIIKRHSVV